MLMFLFTHDLFCKQLSYEIQEIRYSLFALHRYLDGGFACLLIVLPLLYYFKYIDAKLHIINERYKEIVENYLKIIDDGRINDDKPTETLEEAQRYR